MNTIEIRQVNGNPLLFVPSTTGYKIYDDHNFFLGNCHNIDSYIRFNCKG